MRLRGKNAHKKSLFSKSALFYRFLTGTSSIANRPSRSVSENRLSSVVAIPAFPASTFSISTFRFPTFSIFSAFAFFSLFFVLVSSPSFSYILFSPSFFIFLPFFLDSQIPLFRHHGHDGNSLRPVAIGRHRRP